MASRAQATPNWQLIGAFTFGVVFLVVILAIAMFKPYPTPFEYTVFRIVLSLAAAGVGAILPGFIDVSFKNWLRAGGALALFLVVYFYNPTDAIIGPGAVTELKKDSKAPADQWLALVDADDLTSAYGSMEKNFQDKYQFSQFNEVLGPLRAGLGKVTARKFFSSNSAYSPPGMPPGVYRQFVYKSQYSKESRSIYDVVFLAVEKNDWKVSGFSIMAKNQFDQFVPYEAPNLAPG